MFLYLYHSFNGQYLSSFVVNNLRTSNIIFIYVLLLRHQNERKIKEFL